MIIILELVLIEALMIVKNDHERSRLRPTLAKEAGRKGKTNAQIKINLFYL